jgi:hypothetical protein
MAAAVCAVDGVWDATGGGNGSGDLSLDEGRHHSATQPVTSGSGGVDLVLPRSFLFRPFYLCYV